jgi:uncharacterized protein YndB with AHSA1/START domain
MVPERIEREIVIHAPVDVVWAVVTKPEHISGWFSDSVELDLKPGGRAVFHWDGQGSVPGRVERVEEPHLLSFRWAVGPGKEATEDRWTLVEFRLSTEGDSTRLTVAESGFDKLAATDAQESVEGHTRGWKLELGELAEYAEQQAGQ